MLNLNKPVNLASKDFSQHKFDWYEQIREQRPVLNAKISVMSITAVSRYEDSLAY